MQKSTVQEIRERFDHEVERFSNLETGQTATMDAPLCLELVTQAAQILTPNARDLLDIGCGAGNYTLKMLTRIADLNCTLVDLAPNMLAKARERITPVTRGKVVTMAGDMREVDMGAGAFDIVLASATLHHLRTDAEWEAVFRKIFTALRPGGCLGVFDLMDENHPGLQAMMRRRWGEYLCSIKDGPTEGAAYRDLVFGYIEKEDTPRSVVFQIDLLRKVGFKVVDLLHKNAHFAAYVAQK